MHSVPKRDLEQVSWSAGSFLLWRVCTTEASSTSLQLMRRIASVAVSPNFHHVPRCSLKCYRTWRSRVACWCQGGPLDFNAAMSVKFYLPLVISWSFACEKSTYLLEWHWSQDKSSARNTQVINPLQAKRAIPPRSSLNDQGRSVNRARSSHCVAIFGGPAIKPRFQYQYVL